MKDAFVATTAAALSPSLSPDMATTQKHDDHAAEHAHHPNMRKLLEQER